MSRKWLFLVIMVLAIGLVAFAGCADKGGSGTTAPPAQTGGNETPAAAPADKDGNGVLKIGVLVPTTGSEATYGQDMINSYQLAADEINDAGGIKAGDVSYTLELYPQDDACDTAQASTAASKIVSGDVDFVVGGYCSGATTPTLTQFYDAGLIFLITAANSTVLGDAVSNDGYDQTFIINASGDKQIETLEYLISDKGFTKMAIIHQGDDFTQNLYNICTQESNAGELGCELVAGEQVMEKGAADVSAIVTSIKQAGTDLVFFCGYYADATNVIKQLRSGGYTGDICVSDGCSDPNLATASGKEGEGVWVLSPPMAEVIENSEEYIAKYAAKFNGATPRAYSTLAYDTIYLLQAGIEAAGTIEYEAVRQALAGIEYQGIEGTISFSEDRHERSISNFLLVQIQSEKLVMVHAM